jgi:WD40 repeat protein
VNSVAVAALEGRPVAVTGGDDATVRVWDLAAAEPVAEPLVGHRDRVRAEGTWPPASRLVALWDLAGSGDGSVNAVVALGTLEGRAVAVSGGDDQTVRVWDLASGQTTAIVHLDAPVEGLAFVGGELSSSPTTVATSGSTSHRRNCMSRGIAPPADKRSVRHRKRDGDLESARGQRCDPQNSGVRFRNRLDDREAKSSSARAARA